MELAAKASIAIKVSALFDPGSLPSGSRKSHEMLWIGATRFFYLSAMARGWDIVELCD